jgi:hypothetical protein
MKAAYQYINNRKIYLYFSIAVWLFPAATFAADRVRVALLPASPVTMECVVGAAKKHTLPLAALIGILAAEGGRPGEAVSNANGTWDLAAFQVNTVHTADLARIGITPEAVLRDGCANAHAAAWILRREYERTGDIWAAIGAYHSRTPERSTAYIARVKKHLARLEREGLSGLKKGSASR